MMSVPSGVCRVGRHRRCLAAALLAALLPGGLGAQQAIINLPSADITPQGRHFLMHESALKYRTPNDDWATTHFYTYGLGRNTEFTTTVYNLERPSMRNLSVGVGLKTAQPLLGEVGRRHELLLTAGAIVPVSLQGQGAGHWAYGHLSGRLPGLKTRLTAGGGHGTRQVFDREVAVGLFGIEQPLGHHLQFVTEWITGDHGKGFVIPGLLYHRRDWILVAGYKFPNTQRTIGRGLIFEIGRFWGGRRGRSYGSAHAGGGHHGPTTASSASPVSHPPADASGHGERAAAVPVVPTPALTLVGGDAPALGARRRRLVPVPPAIMATLVRVVVPRAAALGSTMRAGGS